MNADALLLGLVKVNIAASLLIVLAFALRRPVRALFGPRVAYGLWALPPLGALASLLPSRVGTATVAPALDNAPAAPMTPASLAQIPHLAPLSLTEAAAMLWVAGVALCLAWLAFRQMRFTAASRLGLTGPAVVGVIRPRIVVPADFETRYNEDERALMRLHERTHLLRQDARVVALAVLLRCLNWFNPLVHLAVRQLRIDQELACDAEVVAAMPDVKRTYAETMLKTQLAASPALPLGCLWPAGSRHPLAERIALLTAARPSRARRRLGACLVTGLTVASTAGAWAALPARPGEVIIQPPPLVETAVARHSQHRAVPGFQPRPAVDTMTSDHAEPVSLVDEAAPALTLTPVAFTGAALAPEPEPDPAPLVEEADWVHKPTLRESMPFYPTQAALLGKSGDVMLRCVVQTTGSVRDCVVLDQPARTTQFGTAALYISRYFVLRPRQVDGVAVNSAVRIPMKFAHVPRSQSSL
jgi:TonB family protein